MKAMAKTLLCALVFLSEGLSQVIQVQHTVTAAVGGEAHFCCQLLQPKDVRQVTWQKVSPSGNKNLASSNKFFGQKVNPLFSHKVVFADVSLQNCSIVLRRLTMEDEGCYRCLFNTYPEGAFVGQTCLRLYELHAPLLYVDKLNSSQELVVTCQVTGRPTPTVTISVLQPHLHLSNNRSVSIPNANGSVTTTSTALLSGPQGLGGARVHCAARVRSGHLLEVVETLPEVQQMSGEYNFWYIVSAVVLVAVFTIALIVCLWFKQKKRKSDPEANRTPLKANEDSNMRITTPISQHVNENVRLRTPIQSPEWRKAQSSRKKKLLFA